MSLSKTIKNTKSTHNKSQKNIKWHYFIHAIDNIDNIYKILNSGKIDINNNQEYIENCKKNKSWYCIPKIYCHYIFSDFKLNKNIIWNWGIYAEGIQYPIIIIKPSILNLNNKILICNELSHGDCIDNAENQISTLKELRKHIKNFIKTNNYNENSYINSHEILFDSIPVDYIYGIIFPTNTENEKISDIKNHIKKLNLNIKISICNTEEKNFYKCAKL